MLLLLLICSSLFYLLAHAKLPESMLGMELQNIEREYSWLLFDHTLSMPSKNVLSAKLTIIQFCIDIDSLLNGLNNQPRKKMAKNSSKNMDKYIDQQQMVKAFEQLRENVEQKMDTVGLIEVCHFWAFEKHLLEIITNKNNSRKQLTKLSSSSSYNCNDLASTNKIPTWAGQLKRDLSRKHCQFIVAKIASSPLPSGTNSLQQWFSGERHANECELAHQFRMVAIQGDVDQIRRVKEVMDRNLLCEDDLSKLHALHPIPLAAYALSETTFCNLVLEMFDKKSTKSSIVVVWLEFYFNYAKIFFYVQQLKGEKNAHEKLGNLWELFMNNSGINVTAFFKRLQQILAELEHQFGDPLAMASNYHLLINSYGNYLSKFLIEDDKFRLMFVEQKVERENLEKLFLIVDKDKKILDNEFWHSFDDKWTKSEEDERIKDEINLLKNYNECPNEQQKIFFHKGNVVEYNEARALMKFYIQLMESEKRMLENRQNNKLLQKLDMDAALWAYKAMVWRELFGFVDEPTNDVEDDVVGGKSAGDKFFEKMDKLKMEWTNKILSKSGQNVNVNSAEKMLCKIHQFALKMIEDETLKMDVKWAEHVDSLVTFGSWASNSFETKLVLLPFTVTAADGTTTNWSKIDCMDAKMASHFVESIKEVPNWTDQNHCYAFNNLLSTFDEFQHAMCYGSGRQLETMERKERLQQLVLPSNAFSTIEATFPEILRYNIITDATYMDLLVLKLSHQSGTLLAEFYEAQLASRFLLNQILFHEKSPINNSVANPSIGNNFYRKIVQVKNEFYDRLRTDGIHEGLQNLCLVFHFYKLLTNFDKRLWSSRDEIDQWKPGCETDNELKAALKDQRLVSGVFHLTFLRRLLEPKPETEWFRDQLKSIPGAKTRMVKMINVRQHLMNQVIFTEDELITADLSVFKEALILWEKFMENNVNFSTAQLTSLYNCILFGEQCTSLCRSAELLQADIVIFVQWMEDQIGRARRTVANKQRKNSWETQRRLFSDVYDLISDETYESLKLRRYELGQLLLNIKQHYTDTNNNNNNKTMPAEFGQKYKEPLQSFNTFMLRFFNNEPMEQYNYDKSKQYRKWIGHLHKSVILKLSREEAEFGEKLRKECSSSQPFQFGRFLLDLVESIKNFEEICNEFQKNDEEIITENKFDNLNLLNDNSPNNCEKLNTKNKKTKNKKKNNVKKLENNNDEKNEESSPKKDGIECENKNGQTNQTPQMNVAGNENKIIIVKNKNENNNNFENSKIEELFWTETPKNSQTDFDRTKLASFEDDHFLSKIFNQFFAKIILNSQDDKDGPLSSTVQLLQFGIYANEICTRLKLIDHLQTVFPTAGGEFGEKIDDNDGIIESLQNEWALIKGVELSKLKSGQKLISTLFLLLKQIVAKMDKFPLNNNNNNHHPQNVKDNSKNEEQIVRNQLLMHNFARHIVENYQLNNWQSINHINKIGIVKALFLNDDTAPHQQTEPIVEQKMLENVQIYLRKYQKLNAQINLDKNIFENFNKYDQFVKQSVAEKHLWESKFDLYVKICRGWYEIDFDESSEMNFNNFNKIKNFIEANGYKENELVTKFIVANELRNIFEHWSNDARFQMPISRYLHTNSEVMSTICIVPEQFDMENVLGKYRCDFAKNRLCFDSSLYCILCKDLRVQFLIAHQIDKLSPVLKLELIFMNVRAIVRFVVVPVPLIPKANFDARHMEPLLNVFGTKIQHLVNDSFYDEFIENDDQQQEDKRQLELKQMLEEELFLEDNDDDKIIRILDKLETISNCEKAKKRTELQQAKPPTETRVTKQQKSIDNREKSAKMKGNLTVLWEHASQLKTIEFLLTRNEIYRLSHQQDQTVVTENTLNSFRTAYAFLELWAKRRNIFNANFGHFNAPMLKIMLTKLFLLFTVDVSVPFLLEKFFLIYSIWNWPLPVQLSEIKTEKEGEFLSWSMDREWFTKWQEKQQQQQLSLEMAVIAPAFPEQNVAKLINNSEALKIKKEFLLAFKTIRAMKGGEKGNEWSSLIEVLVNQNNELFVND